MNASRATPDTTELKPQEVDEAVAQELLAQNENLSMRTSVPLVIVVLFFAVVAWPHAPRLMVILWALGNLLALVIRHQSWHLLNRYGDSARMRLRMAQWLPLIPGVANASAVLFFPYLSDLAKAIFTLILAGLTTGGINTSAGHTRLYMAYMLPVMGALALAWALIPLEGGDQWLGSIMVPMLALYAVTMMSLARGSFRTFKLAIAKRLTEASLNQQLRAALEQAESANAAKTRFLASASHDLRQPLHSLSLFFATLRLQVNKPENVSLLNHIDQALSALQSQMNTLLDMSKLDAGMVKLDWQNFALAPVLHQLCSAYAPIAEQRGLALQMQCAESVRVNSDIEQLGRVLRNLLDNAIKYTQRGQVQLAAFEEAGQIKVRIADTGCGIAPSLHKQVFEEFFQVDNPERDRSRGLGLGLSIVRRLATLLYLELELESTPGVGTTITLSIPKGSGQVRQAAEREYRDTQHSMPMCQVLVLDDEAAVRAGMEALLKRMGCTVMLAANTDEALQLTSERQPDLILADLRLRNAESGITAVQQLRQRYPNLPAIIITGDTAPDRLRQAQAAGLPVLHKPVAADTLMTAIAASLDSAG